MRSKAETPLPPGAPEGWRPLRLDLRDAWSALVVALASIGFAAVLIARVTDPDSLPVRLARHAARAARESGMADLPAHGVTILTVLLSLLPMIVLIAGYRVMGRRLHPAPRR